MQWIHGLVPATRPNEVTTYKQMKSLIIREKKKTTWKKFHLQKRENEINALLKEGKEDSMCIPKDCWSHKYNECPMTGERNEDIKLPNKEVALVPMVNV